MYVSPTCSDIPRVCVLQHLLAVEVDLAASSLTSGVRTESQVDQGPVNSTCLQCCRGCSGRVLFRSSRHAAKVVIGPHGSQLAAKGLRPLLHEMLTLPGCMPCMYVLLHPATQDAFVLTTPSGGAHVWQGAGSSPSERDIAGQVAARLAGGAGKVTTLQVRGQGWSQSLEHMPPWSFVLLFLQAHASGLLPILPQNPDQVQLVSC
jgi:hypothetical protein